MPDGTEQAVVLSKEQKIGFVLLSVFAVLAIGLGALQIRNTMYAPFALNKEIPLSLKDQINNVEALHFRDTDLDGINDFDELYVYGTSPYLADTDSDGIQDKAEIEQGKNPNCAEGKDCAGAIMNAGTVLANGANTSTVSVQDPGEPPADFNAMLSDPAQVRKMLRDVGVDEDMLSKFSDAELLEVVKEMMGTSTPIMNQINENLNPEATVQ
ncbi:hypothetical protein KKA13_04275 [Patescibacteria group bacterium]|nr:hypothetical protein [Patescibacteria group bacterium]MBU1612929.1 hypothetical protein [Patescibacteria group bacterium]